MAEQQTSAPEKKSGSRKLLGMLLGLVLIVLGVVAVVAWWGDVLGLLRGCIGIFLALIGAITIAIAKE